MTNNKIYQFLKRNDQTIFNISIVISIFYILFLISKPTEEPELLLPTSTPPVIIQKLDSGEMFLEEFSSFVDTMENSYFFLSYHGDGDWVLSVGYEFDDFEQKYRIDPSVSGWDEFLIEVEKLRNKIYREVNP